MTFLGFDYGASKIGVAVGQTVTETARGVDTVRHHGDQPDWGCFDRLIADWQPKALVVGLPLAADGEETPMCSEIRRFGLALERRYNLPVHWIDESLTTHMAREMLHESGAGRRRRQRQHHQIAAQLILQTFLRQQTPTRESDQATEH